MYLHGLGVPQDYAEGLQWLQRAAALNYETADYAIGYLYNNGQGVPLDYIEALRWYRTAADKGDARAQYAIGYMFRHGQGVKQDNAEAILWFRKAADQNDPQAQCELGYLFQKGYGVPQNYSESAQWYRKAADQGHAKAESEMGYLAFYGYGVPQDRAEANRWFRKAADQGDVYAQDSLSAKLTPLREFSLGVKLLTGILLTFNFFSFNSWEAGKSLRDSQQKLITAVGVLCLLSAGLGWYGYTHRLIRCLSCGFNAFTIIKWLLDGVLLTFFLYFLREERKQKALAN